MKKLIPFTPQGLNSPVALVSPNASQLVLDVINNSWDKSSSGLGDHHYEDSQSITDADELQEYWEEYSVQLDAEYQILTLSLPLKERGHLLNMSRLTDALDTRFDELDEIKDVAEHGCEGGVGGFIYYNELRTFFFKYEDDIEEYIEDHYGFDYFMERKFNSVNDIICKSVWFVVSNYCMNKYDQHLGGFVHDEEFYPVTA